MPDKRTSDLERLITSGIPDPDNRPLPELVIDHLGGGIQYIDRDGQRLYRVVDWVYEVSGSKAQRRNMPWLKLKEKLNREGDFKVMQILHPLEIQTAGGPQTTDFTTAEGLYSITQRMSDSSSTVKLVKSYLSKAGVFTDDLRRDPSSAADLTIEHYRRLGRDEQWINARLDGKIHRKVFIAALKDAVAETLQSWQYGVATNDLYEGLWQRTAAQLRGEMHLDESANVRDYQPRLALIYQTLAEATAAEAMGNQQSLEWEHARQIVQRVAHLIGQQAQQTGQLLGIDIATGHKLIARGD